MWSQHIFTSFEKDDDDLATIALKSSLADVHATVEGGEFGSAYSIGEYGFYSRTQFEDQGGLLCRLERDHASEGLFLSDLEWKKVDDHLMKVGHYGRWSIQKAVRGDSFAALAVRKNAFHVAIVFLTRGLDVLAENEEGLDLIQIAKGQYFDLTASYKQLMTKQVVYYRQTKTHTEIQELRQEQQTMLTAFRGMIAFTEECQRSLEHQQREIEADLAFKTRCQLLNLVSPPASLAHLAHSFQEFPAEKEFNISRRDRAQQHVADLQELLDFSQQKVQACLQAFAEFEEKLRLYQERKLSLAKAIQRGATRQSLAAITSLVPLSIDEGDRPSADQRAIVVSQPEEPSLAVGALLPATSSTDLDVQAEAEAEAKPTKKILGTLVQTADTVVYYR